MKNNNNPFLETSHLKRIIGDKLFCIFKKVFDFCGVPDAGKFLNQNFDWVAGYNPSYRVYTALLTQSGGDIPSMFQNLDNGTLAIGATYEIAYYDTGDDFTNVGAPSNANGVKFVATGTTAATWSGATELNFNHGAPLVTVLDNTIGNIWLSYDNDGNYLINSNGLFIDNKCWTPTTLILNDTAGVRDNEICEIRRQNANQYIVSTYSQSGGGINDILNNTPIEIRVYN